MEHIMTTATIDARPSMSIDAGLASLRIEVATTAKDSLQDHADITSKPSNSAAHPLTSGGVTVTVTELAPSPPLLPTVADAVAMAETSEVLTTTTSPSPLTTFPLFPLLPAELRILIFQFSFLPRTIELHTRLTHYADMDMNHHHDRMPKWQSLSRNPAALSVSCEARAAALEFYTVALPLAVPLAPNQTFEQPQAGNNSLLLTSSSGHRGRLLLDSDRVLYVNLEVDMIVLLGAEQHYGRLVGFLDWCRVMDVGCGFTSRQMHMQRYEQRQAWHSEQRQNRDRGHDQTELNTLGEDMEGGGEGWQTREQAESQQAWQHAIMTAHVHNTNRASDQAIQNIADVYSPPPPPPPNKGRGIRRLAMSVAPWAHRVGAATLKAFARTVFADMDEFVLFVYAERMPPGNWAGGRCELDEVDGSNYHYREFVTGRGKQFREGDGWMVVGKRPMRVVDLRFVDGW